MRNEGIEIDISRSKYSAAKNGVKNAGLISVNDTVKPPFVWVDGILTREEALDLEPYQKANKIPGMDYICYKSTLFTALNDICKYYPTQFSIYPKTFNLPNEFLDFQREHMTICSRTTMAPTWVIKPKNSCCGTGIIIVQSVHDAQQFNAPGVIQQYVKPFLIEGKKFDFRFYILIASIDPLRIFIYKEGIARFCTEPFQMPSRANRDDKFIHLTNTAINVENSEAPPDTFTKKASIILEEISRSHKKGPLLWNKIKDCVKAVIIGIIPKVVTILPRNRENRLIPEFLQISKKEKERKKKEEEKKDEILIINNNEEEDIHEIEKIIEPLPPLKKINSNLNKKSQINLTKIKEFKPLIFNNSNFRNQNPLLIQSTFNFSMKKRTMSLSPDHKNKEIPNLIINNKEEESLEEIDNKKTNLKPDLPEIKYRQKYFHILGIDIIIDSDLEPQILELNDRPSLAVTVDFEKDLKENLITECFEHVSITGKSFGNSEKSKWEQVYPMDPNEKDYNIWVEIVKKALHPKNNGEIDGVVPSATRSHPIGLGSIQF